MLLFKNGGITMKKTIVIYQSKYGYTKKYAYMLGELLDCPVYNRKRIQSDELLEYDCIIYGGPIYVGGVSGIDVIDRYPDIFKKKQTIVFTCGLTDPSLPETVVHRNDHIKQQLTKESYQAIKIFHLHGGINHKKLPLAHRLVLLLIHHLHIKDDISSLDIGEKEIMNAYGKIVDFTSKEALYPMVEYIKKDV